MKNIVFIRTTGIYDDSRATKEITSLSKSGYHIIILSWDRYGDADEKNRKLFGDLDVEFNYYNCRIPNGIGLKNICKLLGWFRWVKKSLSCINTIDVIYSCNLDASLPALNYAKRNNIHLIYDIYDYYIDSHSIPYFLVPLVEKKEISVINNADITIICTEERKQQIAKAKPKRIEVIYNAPTFIESDDNKEIEYDYVYCGALCSKRLIKEILDIYEYNSDLKFYFAGYGEFFDKCKELAERYPNFCFSGPISYSEVIDIEQKSRCISAIYEPTIRNHRLCAPNKFYEALCLGIPVIVCKGTGIDVVVEQYKIGTVINYSAEEFYAAIRYYKENNKKTESQMVSKNLFVENYDWRLMENKISSFLYDLFKS